MEVAVLIGLQGAGKSTFAMRLLGATHVRISRDVVKTANRERVLQHACFSVEQSFAADNTHPEAISRARLVATARALGARVVAYYFPPDIPAALVRNSLRPARTRVPDVAISATAARLEAPTFAEGFDAIFYVSIVEEAFHVEEVLRER